MIRILVLSLFCAVTSATAQTRFPVRPLQLSVPTPAGSAGDLWARAIVDAWGDQLGQRVLVDNRPGGGGMISIEFVAGSAPDGHTLVMANSSLVTNQLQFRNLRYDAFADFVPIGRIGIAPIVFVADPQLGVKTMQEFIRSAKGKSYNYSSFSVGSPQHLFGHLLSQTYDLGMTHVVYKGESAALPDLLAGRVHSGFFTVTSVKGPVRAGKVNALGALTPMRSPSLPDVPTLLEQGLDKRFAWIGWIAVFAPSKTPSEVQARLTATMESAMKSPAVKSKLEELDMIVEWAGPKDLQAMARNSFEAMKSLRNAANLKPED